MTKEELDRFIAYRKDVTMTVYEPGEGPYTITATHHAPS